MFGIGKKSATPVIDPEGIAIKVMPEEFYSKKGSMSRPASEEPRTASILPPPIPSPASPVSAPFDPNRQQLATPREKPTLIIVLIAVAVLLIGGAIFLFIQSLNIGKEPVKSEPIVEEEPIKEPPAPPAPICGDGQCEDDENSISCLSDCPLPPEPEPVAPVILPMAPDSDGDGLTSMEEELFGVSGENSDTDSDGYKDGLEVINLYNPSGFAPQKIEETKLVEIYKNPTYNFQVFYPKNWLAGALNETNEEIMITSATGEFIQIIVVENKEGLALMDWYLEKAPEVKPADVGTAATKNGLFGIKTPDELTAYFSIGEKIFAISYNVGVKTELNYKSTFEMIIRSFKVNVR
ncbi:hypothetical protein A2316_03100 [Candidatus Falkowbacteria bacterium RIFOXYB2_FULL_38_15]|uniref:Uncharacterized protein n=1 Tax=Candidatus Falkowbacteria bacterium RIFOXYA2_FULL_38_12 TaxID=1797993 RepID=A0A1F5S292_9BACT|nr:MAG: hypothetical protein A2257_03415 [Candidatus Falkowbacteria bacterium RIFOXYA2_FULL_38_12]OGF32654.1 MAG: hypothetical protein A2316_03100 [Candidatus Falkowbacteria bacterium RIFOXYB2_FULL_38_15]OGF42058.1 MAG: hypothetical protein A2555_01530 [Candidatus Falkowbacteria bacterium RIFOXYD2_FULL_39_16]